MAAIDEVLDSAVDGRPGTVMIDGVAGIGKSRLLDEVIGRARASGLRVGVGRADPDDRHTPFVPLLSALFDPSDPIVDRTALSELQALRDQRYWFVLEMEALLDRAAIEQPLLIVLDDVQWADASTLDALRVLSGRLASAPIVWMVTFRPRHDSAALARTVAELEEAKAITLVLEPLAPLEPSVLDV
jgi:predicted ATPase